MGQALRSGQVPADLNIGNTRGATNTEAPLENDGPADMEQVLKYLYDTWI